MDVASTVVQSVLQPQDVCAVCDDVFTDEPEKLAQCRSDCRTEKLGQLRVECAAPWYEVFRDPTKTVCIDGNVFLLQLTVLYMALVVAFIL